ncbi:MAG: hypothetical protein J6T70_18635 [Bacteroidales bacterium]|nr:hypothetical protein [Bacteroidales bacterium]
MLRTGFHTGVVGAGEAVMIGFAEINIQFVDCPKLLAEVVVIELSDILVRTISVLDSGTWCALFYFRYRPVLERSQWMISCGVPWNTTSPLESVAVLREKER